MDKPLVSVVLPVYNGEKYLAESIESVLNQTEKRIELIIVNDCSTDGSLNIINKYKEIDSRIVLINNKTNQKLPNSLNIGFAKAKGDYYTWTSDDNRFEVDAIEKMCHVLDNNSEIGLVYANYIIIDQEGKYINKNNCLEPQYIFRTNCVGACFLYRKTIANSVGMYDSSMFLAEDYEYWIRIAIISKLKKIDEVLYFYRLHPNSLTSTRQKDIKKQTVKMWNKYYDRILTEIPSYIEKCRFKENILNHIEDESFEEFVSKICDRDYVFKVYMKVKRIRNWKKG